MIGLKSKTTQENALITGNSGLLFMVFITIFVLPIFPIHLHRLLYSISYTVVYIMAAMSMEKKRSTFLWLAGSVIILEWLSSYVEMPLLNSLSKAFNITFFAIIVFRLILQIASTRNVTARVIIQSINGYLLLGMTFALAVTLIMIYHPEAFSFPGQDANSAQVAYSISDYFYFTFVTMTTLGYGDLLPQAPYAKSLAILISITGQIYVAIIIATIVGKYAAGAQSNQTD